MQNNDSIEVQHTKYFKDYLRLIKNNPILFIAIIFVFVCCATLYSLYANNIYSSKSVIKINKNTGDILQSPLITQFEEFKTDRVIANEIRIIKSYKLRKRVAEAVTDSFNNIYSSKDQAYCENLFYNILEKDSLVYKNKLMLQTIKQIASKLSDYIHIGQEPGVDIIEIEVESPSSYESALIANVYANEYKNLNLEFNRNQLTFIKNFLNNQKEEKQKELKFWEDTLKSYQEKGSVIALNEQATALIGELSNFEAQKNAAQIELMASDAVLEQYKKELVKQDPALADYLESISSEVYITALQKQLAELQINKDLAISNVSSKINISDKIEKYDIQIRELKAKLNEKIKIIKAGIFASSPTQVKELSQKIIEEEVKNRSLRISISGLKSVVDQYERKFNKLPKTSLELAQYQRGRESLEKLYILVEEKYQEALINEQSQPGNVLIIDEADQPLKPSKPNRKLIIMVGFLAGAFTGFTLLLVRDYFDTKIYSPADIETENINVLGWIPHIRKQFNNGNSKNTLLDFGKKNQQSEGFRTLRTRIQFSRTNPNTLKTILITSSAPEEGKTFITVNLAKSFAQTSKRTIIIDCDLRKPRIHTILEVSKSPGLVDYLVGRASLDSIIHNINSDFQFITAGTTTPNPVELLISEEMKHLLFNLKNNYNYIIIDSPPLFVATDSEILARLSDGIMLVVSSKSTEKETLKKAVTLIKNDKSLFLGTVLNHFAYKRGYASYYKYYNYYND